MNHLDWNVVLGPVVAVLVTFIAGLISLVLTGLLGRIKDYFDNHGNAQMADMVAKASVRMQAAIENAAGNIAMDAEQGHLDLHDIMALHTRLVEESKKIPIKLPDAFKALQPTEGSIYEAIRGKITSKLPTPDPAAVPTVTLNPAVKVTQDLPNGDYAARAGLVTSWLMRDLSLTREQAAGIVGNLGAESGLRAIQEIRPVSGRGGFGWAQWTGVRRTDFENWCKDHGMSVTDDAANYQFLLFELQGTEKAALEALRQAKTVEEATQIVEQKYERAGVVAMDRRQQMAQQAMSA